MESAPTTDSNRSFLPLAEAAVQLGVSRLKLREAIAKGLLPAQRDNQGRLRVDLTLPLLDLTAAMASAKAAPEALMGALFDEIEELSGDLENAQGLTDRLTALAGAQTSALERALASLEAVAVERDRFSGIAGRALEVADQSEARATALQGTTDRALALLDRTTAALESAQGEIATLKAVMSTRDTVIAGHSGQLDRLFSLSEQALEAANRTRRAPGLVARILGTGRSGADRTDKNG